MTELLRLAGLLAALALVTSSAVAQTASPTELRAAFVFNFAKFTEWPPATVAADAPISICVVDDEQASDMFRSVVKGRSVGTHGLAVRSRALNDNLRDCQVVYAPDLDARRARTLLAQVGDSPVLTISDYDQFARMGGVANFVVVDGMMRFAINVESTQRARLKVSSRLLALANVVRPTDDRQ